MKVSILLLIILLVCGLIFVGVLGYTFTNRSNQYGLGTNVIDFSKPFADFASFFNKIGDAGQKVLDIINIGNTPSQLYLLTFDVSYLNETRQAYMLVYGTIKDGISQFNSNSYLFYRIYAFCDFPLTNGNSRALEYLINNHGINYICFFRQDNPRVLVSIPRNVSSYGDVIIPLTKISSNGELNYLSYYDFPNQNTTYLFRGAEVFDISKMLDYDFIQVTN